MTTIHRYNIIIIIRKDLSFAKYYLILIHNKTILKTINTEKFFDEMRYIVEYLIFDIFYFIIMFDKENPR